MHKRRSRAVHVTSLGLRSAQSQGLSRPFIAIQVQACPFLSSTLVQSMCFPAETINSGLDKLRAIASYAGRDAPCALRQSHRYTTIAANHSQDKWVQEMARREMHDVLGMLCCMGRWRLLARQNADTVVFEGSQLEVYDEKESAKVSCDACYNLMHEVQTVG